MLTLYTFIVSSVDSVLRAFLIGIRRFREYFNICFR